MASYLPGVPEVHLGHEVVLLGLLPPLLYAAAVQTSLVDFNANRRLDPAAVASDWSLFTTARRRRRRARADPRHLLADRASRSAPSSRRPTRWPPPRSGAGSGCPAGSSPSSRASRCSTTRPPWSRCAPPWPRPPSGSSAAGVGRRLRASPPGGGLLVGVAGVPRGRLGAQARHRPAARHRDVPGHRRSRRTSSPRPAVHASRRDRRRGRRPAAGPQGPDPADRAVADRRADELAHHRLRPRERRLPADRPAGRLDRRRRQRQRPRRRAGSSLVCAASLVAVVVLRLVWVFPARYLLVRPGRGRRHRATVRRGPTRSSSAGPGCAAWSPWPRRS